MGAGDGDWLNSDIPPNPRRRRDIAIVTKRQGEFAHGKLAKCRGTI
jgi:hypothetical protein